MLWFSVFRFAESSVLNNLVQQRLVFFASLERCSLCFGCCFPPLAVGSAGFRIISLYCYTKYATDCQRYVIQVNFLSFVFIGSANGTVLIPSSYSLGHIGLRRMTEGEGVGGCVGGGGVWVVVPCFVLSLVLFCSGPSDLSNSSSSSVYGVYIVTESGAT